MCLPVSRLFWVSSLAYPNLLGTKGYVVVVVVVGLIVYVVFSFTGVPMASLYIVRGVCGAVIILVGSKEGVLN
jgi:hypothetical protein